MLLARSGSRLLSRSTPLARTMSSFYVLPVDPSAPSAAAATGVDATKLWKSTPSAFESKPASLGTTHLFYGAPKEKTVTALASLGDKFAQKKGDARREAVRKAVASGVKKVRDLGEGVQGSQVVIDASADPHAAGMSFYLSHRMYHLLNSLQRSLPISRRTTSL